MIDEEKDIKEVSKSDDDSSKSFVGSEVNNISDDTDAFWDILSAWYNEVLLAIDKLKTQKDLMIEKYPEKSNEI